jgi:hypothetical protein
LPRNTVTVRVEADAKDFERGFDRAQAKTVGFSAAVGTMAGIVAFQLGTRAIGAVKDFATESIAAASDLEESINAVEVVFGDAADVIHEFGKTSADDVGLAAVNVNKAATVLGSALINAGLDADTAAGKVIDLTTRAADMASVFNTSVPDALGAMQAALRGETDPIERFGVSLNAAAVEAEAAALGFHKVDGEFDNTAKTAARMSLIMKQTERVAGDFANTADSTANTMKRLDERFTETKARVGQALMPAMTSLLEVAEDLAPAFEDFAIEAAELVANLGPLVEGLGALVGMYSDLRGWTNEASESTSGFEQQLGKVTRLLTSGGLAILGKLFERFTPSAKEAAEKSTEFTDALANMADASKDDLILGLADAQGELGDETEITTEAIESQTDALQRHQDELRAITDPTFAYLTAQNELATAQQKYNDAVNEFGENSPEAVEAARDIALANLEIKDSVAAIGTEGVSVATEALKTLGVPPAVIEKFRADRARIEEIFRNMVLRIGVSAPTLFPTSPAGGGVGWQTTTNTYFQKGGIVTRPMVGTFEGTNPEAVIPLNGRGVEILAEALKSALGDVFDNRDYQPRLSPPQSTNVYLDGQEIARHMNRANRLRERAGG